jgi:hypothetical protein
MTDYDNMIAVLQHAKAGGKVEWKWLAVGEKWDTTTPDGLMWNFKECEYRIAVEPPKPKECWAVYTYDYDATPTAAFGLKDDAKSYAESRKSHGYCRMVQDGEYVRVSQ